MDAALPLTQCLRAPCWTLGLFACAAGAAAAQAEVPVAVGVTFTIAVSSALAQPDARAPISVAHGDYEVIVDITAVSQNASATQRSSTRSRVARRDLSEADGRNGDENLFLRMRVLMSQQQLRGAAP